MKISKLLGLNKTQYELDFVDIDIEQDTPLFLDPYFISKCDFPFAVEAHKLIKSYFEFLLKMLKNNNIKEAEELFSYLGETNEICLGLSNGLPRGRGMGPTDAKNIFRSLMGSKALKTGIMEDIEDFRIFVDNVDKDKISDMTTNIIKALLIKYTQKQCELLGIQLTDGVASGYYWDSISNSWQNSYTKMLVLENKKIILVPKRIVSFSKDYTPQKYFQHFVLNFFQNEHLRLNSNLVQYRKDKKRTPYVTKESVKEIIEKDNNITKDWLADFTERHPEVFRDFKNKIFAKINPVKNEEITSEKIEEISNYLIEKLKNISMGSEEASLYHRTIAGIIELLFYPYLCNINLEKEIHEGRKRIDITFDNCADTGFFFRLPSVYRIPASFIIVECKNYSRDINNPELDQISGRFSDSRGKFGLIICRKINDNNLFIQRCRDTYIDGRGLIIPLVDDDIIYMLQNYPKMHEQVVEEVLQKKFHDIALK